MTELLHDSRAGRSTRASSRRTRIVDATSSIAALGGYDAVNMRAVAELAGVSTATLYRHFPSKHHLLVAVLSAWLEEFDCSVDPDYDGRANPFDRLWFVVDGLYTSLHRRPLLAEAMARAYAVADASVAASVEDVRNQMTDVFTAALGTTDRDSAIGSLLSDVWAANVLALSHNRMTTGELRGRLATTVRVLSRAAT